MSLSTVSSRHARDVGSSGASHGYQRAREAPGRAEANTRRRDATCGGGHASGTARFQCHSWYPRALLCYFWKVDVVPRGPSRPSMDARSLFLIAPRKLVPRSEVNAAATEETPSNSSSPPPQNRKGALGLGRRRLLGSAGARRLHHQVFLRLRERRHGRGHRLRVFTDDKTLREGFDCSVARKRWAPQD